ncbi:hypothetical protein FRC03_001313 [Tulasnella sp. 419]|nr:hypothetical protein FRC03_001313 [Tulasnella sp. 419]
MSHRNPHNRRRNSHRDPLTQDPQDVMSTAMRMQWNIRVLQRHDPKITTIVEQFTYAVLYRYDDETWVKKGVEGAMFVYTRTDPPIHGFCVLNREGAGNFVMPMRKGDDIEVTDEYIIFRPADVAPDRFEDFIGIWTSDLVERKRLNTFFKKIADHIAKSEEPYTPVLLHQPLERPEDADKPLSNPLPITDTYDSSATKTPKQKSKKGNQSQTPGGGVSKGGKSNGRTPTLSAAGAVVPTTPVNAAAAATSNASANPTPASPSIESLFSKLSLPGAAPNTTVSVSVPSGGTAAVTTTAPVTNGAAELTGQSLLQTMFASAAGGSAVTTTTSVVPTNPEPPALLPAPQIEYLNDDETLPPPVDGGTMLKQLLGIGFTPSKESSASASPSRPRSTMPSTFVPINENEGSEPSTPPQKHHKSASSGRTPKSNTPRGRSSPSGGLPFEGRPLIPYDDGIVVSPWMNQSLEPARLKNHAEPPSPSQLPRPRAIREREKKAGKHRGKSPSVSSPKPGKKEQYIPKNDDSGAPKLDKNVTADAIISAINTKPSSETAGKKRIESGLDKDKFVQELLGLIHRTDDFVDIVYRKYEEGLGSRPGTSTK